VATSAVSGRLAKLAGFAAAAMMLAVLSGISFTGRWPTDATLEHLTGEGIIALPAEQVAHVDIVASGKAVRLDHAGGGWAIGGATLDPGIAKHIDMAIRLLNVSSPRRSLQPGEYDAAKIAEFRLDPPKLLVSLVARDGKTSGIAFGEPTPAENSQFVHLLGQPTIALLSRYVGVEWQMALDLAERVPAAAVDGEVRPKPLFLPMSFATIWAVEIVQNGALTRFERDPAGDWFHHLPGHVHKPGGFVHKADPHIAPLLAAEFAALERASVEVVVAKHPDGATLAADGLEHPPAIMMMYARDSLGAVARVEFGNPTPDGFGRYARVRETDNLVSVPRYVAAHLDRLLQLAGGRS
jgi:hypothetical protein